MGCFMKFASLFSGCGGFDLGFMGQGFQPVGAYDFDSDACENFKANVDSQIQNVDLRSGIPDVTRLKDIDVLVAGPPCQGFSTVGKRNVNDERNHLVTLTGDLAVKVHPKVLVVENVPGVLSGEHSRYWSEMDDTMRNAGYRTHTLCCQASDFGMAQLRKRVLFFAWRTNRDVDFDYASLPAGHIRNALEGVRGKPNHKPKRLKPNSRDWNIAKRIRPGQKLSNVRGGEKAVAAWDIPEVFGLVSEHERTVLELLRRLRRQKRKRDYGDADPVSLDRLEAALGERFHNIVESLIEKRYLRRVDGGIDLVGTFNGKYRRLAWEKPSCTVDTRFGSPRYFLHPDYPRGFTVREAARLQGFDDDYIFTGNENAQYRIIGNAVPPLLGAFAAGMSKRLLGETL